MSDDNGGENGNVLDESIIGAEDAAAVEEAEAAIEHDVEALLTERDSFREIAQRLQADFENYRKRIATQTQARGLIYPLQHIRRGLQFAGYYGEVAEHGRDDTLLPVV